MHQYDYLIEPRADSAARGGADGPQPADTERIVAEAMKCLAFYDGRSRIEITGSEDGTPCARIRVITGISNSDIVDSIVRISGLPLGLLASRIESAAMDDFSAAPITGAGMFDRAIRMLSGHRRH